MANWQLWMVNHPVLVHGGFVVGMLLGFVALYFIFTYTDNDY